MYAQQIDEDQTRSAIDELPSGSTLFHGNYRIKSAITSGGFGITYFAQDHSGKDVVIKECFSGAHCRRSKSKVIPRTANGQKAMSSILRNFLKEARSLSSLNHKNIVHVHQVFQENETAYMVMDRIPGDDLLNLIETRRKDLTPSWIVLLAVKMVAALSYVHANDILHRDVSPDNIFISTDDQPVLIDFGAATWISDGDRSSETALTIVKDGYSPHELYFSGGNVGPWTDVYSLGASLYHVITGIAPINSQSRIAARADRGPDPLSPLAGTFEGFPPGFLESIDKAMRIFPAERYQTSDSWMEDLKRLEGFEEIDVKLLDKALGFKRPTRPAKLAQPTISPETVNEDTTSQNVKGQNMALDITGLNEITGFIGGCLVDSETGMMLAAVGGGKFDLEAASAANTEVVVAKNRAIKMLGLEDGIEDILITLGKQFHLIRPLEQTPSIFLYVALDRKSANLGLSRVQVKKVEQTLSL